MIQGTEYKDLLSVLEDIQDKNTVEIKVPTTGTKCIFKKISVNQQKNILKSAVDMSLPELQFLLQINKILTENQVTDIPLHITDRMAAIIELRVATLGGKIDSSITSSSEDVDITSHIKSFKKIKLPASQLKHTFKHEDFTVTCQVPTLDEDTEINLACLKEIHGSLKTEEGLKESIGEVFVYEIIKYIKTVSFTDSEETPVNIPFDTLSYKQRITIFEKLPMGISMKLSKYITSLRDFDDKFLKIPVDDGSSKEDTTVDIDFTAGFFSLE